MVSNMVRFGRLFIALAVVIGLWGPFPTPLRAERADKVRTESFELLNRGVAAYRRGDFKEAVEKLQRSAAPVARAR